MRHERPTQTVPGAEHVVLPGLGHMANLENPTRFNEAVLHFLAQPKAPS